MKRKEHLSPRRAGGKCWIKSATSEKCLDIAITAMSAKSHSCATLETLYICPSFIFSCQSSSIPTSGCITSWSGTITSRNLM